jgi:hypothetical protein
MTPTFEESGLWFTPERLARFWQHVDKRPNGCWFWKGALTDTGHGQYRMMGGVTRVHRLTWIMARLADIPDWMVIRHFMCDNKPCCNPSHLLGGTQGENVQDIWLIHAAYRRDVEMRARERYRNHPYVGGVHDALFVIPPACEAGQSIGYTKQPCALPIRYTSHDLHCNP